MGGALGLRGDAFFAEGFFAGAFLAAGFWAAGFFGAAAFLAGAFFFAAAGFLAVADFVVVFIGTTLSPYKETALKQSQQIRDLESIVDGYERFERLASELRPELQVLYPHIRTISLARIVEERTDTALPTPVIVALVTLDNHHRLTSDQTSQLAAWLQARAEVDSIQVIIK